MPRLTALLPLVLTLSAALSAQTFEFGEGCPADRHPRLSVDVPIAGREVQICVKSTSASTPAVLLIGNSRTDWNGLPLPLSLRLIGAPDCALHIAPEVIVPFVTDPEARASLLATMPPAGVTGYLQVFSLEGRRLTNSPAVRVAPVDPLPPFKIAVVPDTQSYTVNETDIWHFRRQTQWIYDHIASDNIKFVTHVGDVVEHGAEGNNNNAEEWRRAISAWVTIEAASQQNPDGPVPFAVQIGNRDFDRLDDKRSADTFTANFDPVRLGGRSWWRGYLDACNSYQVFPASGGDFLHIGLEWRPSDVVIAWAHEVLRRHPDLPAIVTTHEYLDRGGNAPLRTLGENLDGSGDNSGVGLYHKLVEPNPQVFLVLCGHMFGDGRRSSTTPLDAVVHQVLANYQDDPNGGNGWMALLEFRLDAATIAFRTFSPTYQSGITPGPDRSAGPGNFTLPFDLHRHRATLAATRVLHFRDGLTMATGTYNGTRDTHVGTGVAGVTHAATSYANATSLRIDADGDSEQALLRFENLFGNGTGQIPPGARIRRAILTLTSEGAGAPTQTGVRLHRMLVDWSENSTWSSLGGGVRLGTMALGTFDADAIYLTSQPGTHSIDVTASVNAWRNGAPNHGWLLQAKGNDLWTPRSSEWPAVAERPMLTVVIDR